jgi:endoglucanase
MKRRDFLARASVFGGALMGGQALALVDGGQLRAAGPVWDSWKAAFLQSDGRVVDGLQQQASHSEGQGYGMLAATLFKDEAAFRLMLNWTERHLAIRPDPLLAWRWLPGQANPVPDRNNASDGDLFFAWALVRAAAQFQQPAYLARATEIALALAAHCIKPMPGASDKLVFLPAAFGFAHEAHVTLNPSYYMPQAMRELAAATGVTALAACAQHGQEMMDAIAAVGLVPDWVDVSARGIAPSATLSANTGYEAIRVPLFLVWSRMGQHMAVRRMAAVYERALQPGESAPTVIEPMSGVVLETSADPGYQALAGVVLCAGQNSLGAQIPPFTPNQPYYPATLQLFAMFAATDALPECVPL